MLIIPGFQKTGSTTLYEIFSYNNKLYAPSKFKDFHLFNDIVKNDSFIHEYVSSSKKFKVHCAVNYILNSDSIQNILKYFPESIFLVVVRDPIERAQSAFHYFEKMGLEFGNINDVIQRELVSDFNKPIQELYLEPGLYWKHMKNNLLPYVEKSKVFCFLYEEIFSNGKINLDQVFDAIGLEKFYYPDSLKRNSSGKAKLPALNRILFDQNVFKSTIAKFFPLEIRTSVKSWIYENNISSNKSVKESFSEETILKLKQYFQTDVDNLSKEFLLPTKKYWKNFS